MSHFRHTVQVVLDPRRMPRLPRTFKLVADAVDLLFHLQRQQFAIVGTIRSWLKLSRPQATTATASALCAQAELLLLQPQYHGLSLYKTSFELFAEKSTFWRMWKTC